MQFVFAQRGFQQWRGAFLFVFLLFYLAEQANAQSTGPVITSISPKNVPVGAPSTEFDIIGTGFTNGMVVRLNDQSLFASFISSNELRVTVPGIFFQYPLSRD